MELQTLADGTQLLYFNTTDSDIGQPELASPIACVEAADYRGVRGRSRGA